MKEIWKPVTGLEKYYEISNKGRLRSFDRKRIAVSNSYSILPRRFLKPHLAGANRALYYSYSLVDGNGKKFSRFLHRLVATAFIPNPQNKPFVNHKNGNKLDNRIKNLEWVTAKENSIRAYKTGLMGRYDGIYSRNQKLTPEEVKEIRLISGVSSRKIAKLYGVSKTQILDIRNFKSWPNV